MKTKLRCIAGLLLVPLAASAQTAEEIVKKALDARGGVEKIKGVQTERVTGQVSFSREMEGTFIVELKRPLKMRTEITVEGPRFPAPTPTLPAAAFPAGPGHFFFARRTPSPPG